MIGPPTQARLPLTDMHVHRATEGGFLPRFPVVVMPPAAHGAVSEFDHVIGEWILLHRDTELRAEQYIRLTVNLGRDRVAVLCGRGRGRGDTCDSHDRGTAELPPISISTLGLLDSDV